jgi:VanZ family protein
VKNKYFKYALLWTLFTIVLSLISKSTASKLQLMDFLGIDKLYHLLFYALMAWLWAKAFEPMFTPKRSILYASVLPFFIGIFMEFCQKWFSEGRAFEYDDMVANSVGMMVGLLVFVFRRA